MKVVSTVVLLGFASVVLWVCLTAAQLVDGTVISTAGERVGWWVHEWAGLKVAATAVEEEVSERGSK